MGQVSWTESDTLGSDRKDSLQSGSPELSLHLVRDDVMQFLRISDLYIAHVHSLLVSNNLPGMSIAEIPISFCLVVQIQILKHTFKVNSWSSNIVWFWNVDLDTQIYVKMIGELLLLVQVSLVVGWQYELWCCLGFSRNNSFFPLISASYFVRLVE